MKNLPQPRKYHNRLTEYNGVCYHSMSEADYARQLDLLQYSGEVSSWKRQVRIPIVVNGQKVCDYIMDFVINHEGYTELVEIKGFQTESFKLKKKLLCAAVLPLHRDWIYRVIDKNGAELFRSKIQLTAVNPVSPVNPAHVPDIRRKG